MKKYVKKVLPIYMGKIIFKFNNEFLSIYAYLIYTEDGDIYIFDTGLNPLFYRSKEQIMENLINFVDVEENVPLDKKFQQFGIKKENIKAVILSHLHFDHAGGVTEFEDTDVPIIVQKRECEVARNLANGRAFEYKTNDIESIERNMNLVTIEGDSFVDGNEAMKCLTTYGHSAGHQSLLLEGRNKNMILTGDVAYTREQLDASKISTIPFRKQEALDSVARVQKIAKHCDYVICGHDCDVYREQIITL